MHNYLDPLLVHWLHTFDHPRFNLEVQDHIMWDGLSISKVKTWHVQESICSRAEEVPWFLAVCHKLRINWYAHHQWLVCHGRLSTSARLARFGISKSLNNVICILVGGRLIIIFSCIVTTVALCFPNCYLSSLLLVILGCTFFIICCKLQTELRMSLLYIFFKFFAIKYGGKEMLELIIKAVLVQTSLWNVF